MKTLADRNPPAARLAVLAAVAGLAVAFSAARAPSAELPAAPARLSATELYTAHGEVDPANRPFSPQYPLWTDGAVKSRWIHLPPGARIDVADPDAWQFPVGTRLWKEFAWNGRKVETRFSWRASAQHWVFATYVWNEAQDDATLVPPDGVPDAVDVGAPRRHSIPGLADCESCHGGSPVLGFDALQLSDDRDPLAPHAEPPPPGAVTLATLVAKGLLAPPRPEWVRDPPRIRTADPIERAALGYLAGNCGGCHDARGPSRASASCCATTWRRRPTRPSPRCARPWTWPESSWCRGRPGRLTAGRAGAPERSAIVARMRLRRPSSQMPPLGTVAQDAQALALIERWISGLHPRVRRSREDAAPAGAGSRGRVAGLDRAQPLP
ncbi:MAG: hypothetical protein IPK07_32810 [Deltaproteobacteria bacterium]|nr:hypothetical protein [Deltaproteobacteria bacterium]